MDVIKEESYHPFRMQKEQSGITSVHGHDTMNTLVLVLHTGI
jgi:hypothetical protein